MTVQHDTDDGRFFTCGSVPRDMACTVVSVPTDTPPENGDEPPANGGGGPQPPTQVGGLPVNAIALVAILAALWGLSRA